MKKYLPAFLFAAIVSLTFSWIPCSAGSLKGPDVNACMQFMKELDAKNLDKVITCMDSIVLHMVSDSAWANEIARIYGKMKKDYTGKLKFTPVSMDKTKRETLPVSFILVRVESDTRFGYYSFYVNALSHKIMMVQIAVEALPKQDG